MHSRDIMHALVIWMNTRLVCIVRTCLCGLCSCEALFDRLHAACGNAANAGPTYSIMLLLSIFWQRRRRRVYLCVCARVSITEYACLHKLALTCACSAWLPFTHFRFRHIGTFKKNAFLCSVNAVRLILAAASCSVSIETADIETTYQSWNALKVDKIAQHDVPNHGCKTRL